MISSATMTLDPAFFATPDDANGDGVFNFPSATHTRPHWGGAFRVGALYSPNCCWDFGALYSPNCCWDFGASYHSETWFETFEYNSADEIGRAQTLRLPFTLPSIISVGAAYKGIPNTLIAVDARYFNYTDTKTLGDSVADGGVAWDSIWAVAAGIQYQLTQRTSVRLGYSYNENPIDSAKMLFNTQLPGFAQHVVAAGATMQLTCTMSASVAYLHTFENSIEGPIAQLAGANINMDTRMDSLLFGLNFLF